MLLCHFQEHNISDVPAKDLNPVPVVADKGMFGGFSLFNFFSRRRNNDGKPLPRADTCYF